MSEIKYEKIRSILIWCAKRFQRIYGGEFADIYQNAWLIFLENQPRFDQKRGTLEAWAMLVVFDRLRKKSLHEWKRRKYEQAAARKFPQFDLERFLAECSNDTAAIARLVIDLRPQIFGNLRFRRTAFGQITAAGFTRRQIFTAFREIRAALV